MDRETAMIVDSLANVAPVRQYLKRIGATLTGLRRAKVSFVQGKYECDHIIIDFSKEGVVSVESRREKIDATSQFHPTDAEREAITAAFASLEFPYSVPCDGAIPIFIERTPAHLFWPFRNRAGEIEMIVQRVDLPDGKKRYVTHSYWSDGKWRQAEPEGLLPMYGVEQIDGDCAVMVHEGPKAARAAQQCAKDKNHPWHDTLKNFVHLGWHGGAGRPMATDWSPLSSLTRIVFAPDHDAQGRAVVRRLCRMMPREALVMQLEWDAGFPEAWDMADKIPDCINDNLLGPKPLWSFFRLATFATELSGYTNPEKQTGPIYQIRDVFQNLWQYVSQTNEFINFPTVHDAPVIKTAEEFDAHYRPWSDVKKTSELMLRNATTYKRAVYIPGRLTGPYNEGSEVQNINTYVGPRIKPVRGDLKPFFEYLSIMLPEEWERLHVQDWIATLIAKPGERPGHALLLSSAGGTGKTSLSDFITPCVGEHNAHVLSAETFEKSPFSEHLENRVLITIPEIYCGHSWYVGNKIKSMITDRRLEIHPKGKKAYNVSNTLWFMAFSNDPQPIKLDADDRRWFIPEVSNDRQTRDDMEPYYRWARAGGFEALLYWALNYERMSDGRVLLPPGTNAPWTKKKETMADSSETQDVQEALDILKGEIARRSERGENPNFTFSIGALREISQQSTPESKRLSPSAFSSRLAQARIANAYGSVAGERGSNIRLHYVGVRPATDDEAKMTIVNLDRVAAI